ncbi:MAG: endonuclease/exonuclease/phosphatase family protein [Oscillospiraceae bacterium]|nr:endonuclease/exonuclease/phosphatase family protein [Oscillospiraceae bacterium]
MKILTLNTHSLREENYRQKLEWFLEGVLKEKPDIIALQEVNQTATEALIDPGMLEGQYPVPGCMEIRRDNHAANIASRLRQAGLECYWAWLPIKRGYEKYDEGVAILSIGRKIRCLDQFPISRVNDYGNWRTRAVLGVQVEGLEDWFYCLHMGWWDDASERFLDQWRVLNSCIMGKRMCTNVWLLGDFNAPDAIPGQSYEHMVACGWIDTYRIARRKDSGITVPGIIDGWREAFAGKKEEGMRTDYIWCSHKKEVLSSRVMFNGTQEPVVSDHFGVLVEIKEKNI